MKASQSKRKHSLDEYAFSQLDGRHPWQEQVPEGALLYPTRELQNGKVSYFNYDLAKEMGLIPAQHPHRLTKKLTDQILHTFCLRIINEYDKKNKITYDPKTIRPNPYMATRYLQLQHSDKTGRTSGDGRCIWNGVAVAKGKIWDVSSRGTGVTALAPGVVEAGRPLKSGNNAHGYGCGMAEIDELFGAAILAEIFHRNGIATERVLAIIDLGKGVGIGVRAAHNLIRPAHLFMFLKQNKLEPLRNALDYLIDRQYANKEWSIKSDDKNRYRKMLDEITRSFASFAARLDRDYIFAWLDWDGDNVLANAGIIDYGSVRQFGLRHDQYRYDDIDRMSTNLNEQKKKAREIVHTFAQLVDFAETGKKQAWRKFTKHSALAEFDRQFEQSCLEHFLFQIGFPEPQRRLLIQKHRSHVEEFFKYHSFLERVKTHRKMQKVADGVHRPAIFNMRMALALMPQYIKDLPFEAVPLVDDKEFLSWILASTATGKDRKPNRQMRQKFKQWQSHYLSLVRKVCTPATWQKTATAIYERAAQINNESRITGNALIQVVDEILRQRRRGISDAEIQVVIDALIEAQTLNPDARHSSSPAPVSKPVMRNFLSVVHGAREDI